MRPIIIGLVVLMHFVVQPISLFAQNEEKSLPPVEEWQIKGILAALKDSYPEVRHFGVNKLAELLDATSEKKTTLREWKGKSREIALQSANDLILLLKDAKDDIRFRAVLALGKLKVEKAIPDLILFLKDTDVDVRHSAADALGNLKAEKAIPDLILLLKDTDHYVSRSAAYALGNLKAEVAIPDLILLLKDTREDVIRSAAYALGNLKARKAIPDLILLLKDDNNVRHSAAYTLGNLKAEEAIPDLILLLKDTREDVIRSAADALGILSCQVHDSRDGTNSYTWRCEE